MVGAGDGAGGVREEPGGQADEGGDEGRPEALADQVAGEAVVEADVAGVGGDEAVGRESPTR